MTTSIIKLMEKKGFGRRSRLFLLASFGTGFSKKEISQVSSAIEQKVRMDRKVSVKHYGATFIGWRKEKEKRSAG